MAIKYVVVVMFENRSYDNILGWLYNSSNQPPYNQAPPGQADLQGLKGNESNPDPIIPGATIPVHNQTTPTQKGGSGISYPATAIPIVDPGEPFDDMAQQFLGSASKPTSNPYTDYPPSDTSQLMQGFTTNYVDPGFPQPSPPAENIPDVMNYFTPAQLPVTSFLANNYGVCDTWFASVPTQTFTNRVFAFCAAPGIGKQPLSDDIYSWVDDGQYLTAATIYDLPSILSQLDNVLPGDGPNWKIYFHDYSISIMTVPFVANIAGLDTNINISTFNNLDWGTTIPKQLVTLPPTFIDDLACGKLPPFSFIEPRYSRTYAVNNLAPNSNHPGPTSYGLNWGTDSNDPPTDCTSGEYFLMQLYNLLQSSSIWNETLLIITYDEHGGVYDHVPPPPATPPATVHLDSPPPFPNIPAAYDDFVSAADGFTFNVLGGRVPAIVVSPWIAAGSRLVDGNNAPFDHTSIIRTVWDLFNLSQSNITSLTARDAAAPSLTQFLTAEASNDTGPFSGVILTSPASLIFTKSLFHDPGPQVLFASAGNTIALTAASHDSWLEIEVTGTTNLTITASVDTHGLRDGTHKTSISITGSAANSPCIVPVTLVVSLL